MNIGDAIIHEIIAQPMFTMECPDAPGSGCLAIWNGTAPEQLDSLVTQRLHLVLGALDSLGIALTQHGHVWTVGERAIYEAAIEILTGEKQE